MIPDLACGPLSSEKRLNMPRERHDGGSQSAINRTRGPRRHAGCLDGAVEGGVELAESFIMKPVARLVNVEESEDEAWFLGETADTAGCLDIFGGGFGLSLDDHQAKPADVQANRDHVGSESHVDAVRGKG